MELAAVVPDADYNEMHVSSRDANLEVNRPQSGALLRPAVQARDSQPDKTFFLLCLFQSPREGEEHETAALATRRLDQLPEMIRLWPGIFLMTLQTLFSSHISLRESFNKSILGWKWFLQLFIIVVSVERGLSSLVAFYGHLEIQGTK